MWYVFMLVLELALLRAGLISVGIGGALLMNSLLFPRHCRVSISLHQSISNFRPHRSCFWTTFAER